MSHQPNCSWLVTVHSFFLFLSSSLHRGCMPSSLFSRWTKSFTCVSHGILFFTKGSMTSRAHRLLVIYRVVCRSRLKSGIVALVSLLLCECGIGNNWVLKVSLPLAWWGTPHLELKDWSFSSAFKNKVNGHQRKTPRAKYGTHHFLELLGEWALFTLVSKEIALTLSLLSYKLAVLSKDLRK